MTQTLPTGYEYVNQAYLDAAFAAFKRDLKDLVVQPSDLFDAIAIGIGSQRVDFALLLALSLSQTLREITEEQPWAQIMLLAYGKMYFQMENISAKGCFGCVPNVATFEQFQQFIVGGLLGLTVPQVLPDSKLN